MEKGPAVSYEIVLKSAEGGWFVAQCPKLPGCISQGKTEAEALTNIREAIAGWLWAEKQKNAEAQL